jgi:hypothetical protein
MTWSAAPAVHVPLPSRNVPMRMCAALRDSMCCPCS